LSGRVDHYDKELKWHCQRFSNYSSFSNITDEELITIYLYAVSEEEKTKLAQFINMQKNI
jgi:hypothetical protein